MLSLAAILLASLLHPAQDSQSPEEGIELTRDINSAELTRCMGNMVGFRNIRVTCVVGPDGVPEQCQVVSTNPTVLRYRSRFECMGRAMRITMPDGSSAAGRRFSFRLQGRSG
ncbi:hypothetical protein [Brevundimonas subvibrioides]|uniref:TonB C-terminal domain-containing protein n=1 Tax=Brevundimonas subvibrioides (strain ATCC 15264 / DSM 4735 / LMG 14903 / NBRC 16000 / CB 81) TaxID=633149 RepID=D9QFR6_BRESC|nr:hypothetical protein [Brevundimonas subvibrioides]ADL00630.1 hypothetical protein Bresu_1318 [Brevundimonas subvibrioides ATCC 15264]